jgi:hypothetical protein
MTLLAGFPVGQLDSDVNECWLLHGTTADAVGAIAQNGIDLRLANPTGRYGSGIYLAESSIKANIYTGKLLRCCFLQLFHVCFINICVANVFC